MPEFWVMCHEKNFIARLSPRLIPGYLAGLSLRWYAPWGDPRRLLREDERIELGIAAVHGWRGPAGHG